MADAPAGWENAPLVHPPPGWETAAGVVGSAVNATGGVLNRMGVPRALDLLDRPRQTVQAGLAGDGPLRTFVHGAGPDQQDANRATIRKTLGLPGDAERAQLGGFRGGLDDFALDTITGFYPASALGALGKLGKGLGRFGAAGAKAVAPKTTHDIGRVAHGVEDFFTYGGSAKRDLGKPLYNKALAADNRQQAKAEEAARRLTERFERDLAPLPAPQKAQAYQVMKGAVKPEFVDPHIAAAAAAGRKLTDDAAYIQANESGRRWLAYGKGGLGNAQLSPMLREGKAAERELKNIHTGREQQTANRAAWFAKQHEALKDDPLVTELAQRASQKRVPKLNALGGETGGFVKSPAWDSLKPEQQQRFLDDARRSIAQARWKSLGESGQQDVLGYREPHADLTRENLKAVKAMEHSDDAQGRLGLKRTVKRAPDPQYQLPENLKEFAAPPEQGIFGYGNLRKNYLPGPREAAEVAADQPAKESNLLRPFAPNLIQREDFFVNKSPKELALIDDAFRGALKNAGRQATAGKMRAELGVPLDLNAANREPTALENLFTRKTKPTGSFRSPLQVGGDIIDSLVNIPKNTVTTLGGKHALVNVPALAAGSEGAGAAAKAVAGGARVAKMKPAQRYEALRPGIEGGVITPFIERKNPIAEAVGKIPGPVGKVLGGASKGMNRFTWGVDDAAKQAVFQKKIARGMDPDTAAAETLREMVDYGHRSKFTQAASHFMPFGTFRTKIPGAVSSATLRAPQRALALNRATTGLFGGGSVQAGTKDDGSPRTLNVTTPQADVFGGFDERQRYARAALADPYKALLSAVGHVAAPSARYDPQSRTTSDRITPNYFTYGQPVFPHLKDGKLKAGFAASQAAGYLPYGAGEDLLNALGVNEFPAQSPLSVLLGSLLGAHTR